MAVRRGVLETVRITADAVTDQTTYAAATFVAIPLQKLLNRSHAGWKEEAVTDAGVNDTPGGAAVKGAGVLMIALDTADTFLATAETADANRTGLWVEYVYSGSSPFVAGGANGCTVNMANMPGAQFGALASKMLSLSASGGLPGSTYAELTAL